MQYYSRGCAGVRLVKLPFNYDTFGETLAEENSQHFCVGCFVLVQFRDSNMEPRSNFRIFADDCGALCAAQAK